MGETRTRLGSVDAKYYPSLDQILSAHDDDLNKFLSKTKKDNIVCLFRGKPPRVAASQHC